VGRKATDVRHAQGLIELLKDVTILPFDKAVAEYSGNLRASLMDKGVNVPLIDLLIASTALFHNYTLVTHNVKHYSLIPSLRVEDWLL
jgi:tRNA(fMet)-specific endonuclease VapC